MHRINHYPADSVIAVFSLRKTGARYFIVVFLSAHKGQRAIDLDKTCFYEFQTT